MMVCERDVVGASRWKKIVAMMVVVELSTGGDVMLVVNIEEHLKDWVSRLRSRSLHSRLRTSSPRSSLRLSLVSSRAFVS